MIPVTELYTRKIEFGGINGADPTGNLTMSGGKFYGMTQHGGIYNKGVIFEWDPATNIYTKRFDFNLGSSPVGNLIRSGDKFYGTTELTDIEEREVIFEWDPLTNIYIEKFRFDYLERHTGFTLSKGKFYLVVSTRGGTTVAIWDPATNVYTQSANFLYRGDNPVGSLTEKDEKFYGMSQYGGYYGEGSVFEWNPLTDSIINKYDFDQAKEEGIFPKGSLTVSGSKLYGMTSLGGSFSGEGVIFEWDPATNTYNKKKIFDGTGGAHPDGNDLTLTPAPVAKGLPGSCVSLPPVNIDSSNNNKWVAITDDEGNAIMEIKANRNNLGIVSASLYTNNGSVREDQNGRLYLDRNVTITPQVQPKTPVDIRLYIKSSEYVALKNAVNSSGQPSGIDSINSLTIYKVEGDCLAAATSLTNAVATTVSSWENDYVASASTSSFSSFYFAGKSVCTAPVITQVCANPDTLWPPDHRMKNVTVHYKICGGCGPVSSWLTVISDEPEDGTGRRDKAPDWVIADNHHLQLRAERAHHGNGRVYTIIISAKDASGNLTRKKIKVVVPHRIGGSSHGSHREGGYFESSGDYFEELFDCKVFPNPSRGYFELQIESASVEGIEMNLYDINGRLISTFNIANHKTLSFGENLKPGAYTINIKQGKQQKILKLIKL
jgi:uncharacterized repeat protein (TIGR03803 family)